MEGHVKIHMLYMIIFLENDAVFSKSWQFYNSNVFFSDKTWNALLLLMSHIHLNNNSWTLCAFRAHTHKQRHQKIIYTFHDTFSLNILYNRMSTFNKSIVDSIEEHYVSASSNSMWVLGVYLLVRKQFLTIEWTKKWIIIV